MNFFIKDIVRNKALSKKPEEIVRQGLISFMIDNLGFEKSFISIEVELKNIAKKRQNINIPKRRVDILAFYKCIKEKCIKPLLIIECKAIKLSKDAVNQVIGYNYYVGAPYIAIVNQNEVQTYFYNKKNGKYHYLGFLPKYSELIQGLNINGSKK